MADVFVPFMELCFALFGPGLFFAANAAHYATECFTGTPRVLLLLTGMAATAVLLPALRDLSGSGSWMRFTCLSGYCVFCLHGLLAVFETHHRVPVALLAMACLFVARQDAVVTALLGAFVAAVMFIWNYAAPLHDNARPEACEAAPAAIGLLLAGALHAFPAALLFASSGVFELNVFLAALLVHALPLAALNATVWVPVLLQASYADMLFGGVSPREAATLVVQACAQLTVCAAAAWLMMKLIGASGGLPHARLLEPAPYFAFVLVSVAAALFLLNFAFGTLVMWMLGIFLVMFAQFVLL
jgi:hypothetical protein